MSRIVVSDEQRSQVNGLAAPSEVCDASGNLLGYILSPELFAEYRAAWEREEAELDELDRRLEAKDVGTLQELWKELGVE